MNPPEAPPVPSTASDARASDLVSSETDFTCLSHPDRLAALARTGLMDSPGEAAFDRLTLLAQRVLNAPVILISLVDDHRQFFKSEQGLSEPWNQLRQTPLTHSFCKHVVATGQPFIVTDAQTDPRVMHNGATKDLGVASYLGLPLTDLDGQVIGSFCAIDGKPRSWSDEDQDALRDFASLTMTETELRTALREARDAQTQLAHANHLLRQVTESAPSIIYLYNFETGSNVYANQSIETVLGYTAEEIAAMKDSLMARLIHPDDMPLMEQHLNRFGGCADGEHQELEYRVRDRAGCWRWLRSRETIFERNKDGTPRLILGVAEDFSQRQQAECSLRETAAELQRSNQALQEFASVASHDLQEPLRKILAFGDRLRVKTGDTLDASSQDYLDRMMGAALRMQTLIGDLLQFSRVTSKAQPFAPVDLNVIVEGVLSDLEAQVQRTGGHVDVEPLPVLFADPLQMRQLFQNLIGNALKFSKPGVPPRVTVRAQGDPAQNSFVRVTVEDNGIGFDTRHADRIFEVFERLNRRGDYEGNGIGLAICRRIVERHGGVIEPQGTPGAGARFVVALPVDTRPRGEDPCSAPGRD